MMAKTLEQRVEELENIVKELRKDKLVRFGKSLGIGDTFELAGLTWKILDITEKGYMCLADKLENKMKFDDSSSNWVSSDLRNYLDTDFLKMISEEIGAENIIEFERDLLALDGQTEYGSCEDKVSLLAVDEYRKYRKLIPNTRDYWWWLVSPWSTPCNGYEVSVAVVSSQGCIYSNDCGYDLGVRPVCIFSSSIFESGE